MVKYKFSNFLVVLILLVGALLAASVFVFADYDDYEIKSALEYNVFFE